jgi:hypothetical protein
MSRLDVIVLGGAPGARSLELSLGIELERRLQ